MTPIRACIAALLTFCGPAAADLLVSNFFSSSVDRYSPTGLPLGTLSGGSLSGPLCARLGPDGLLYVASEGTNSVLRYNPQTYAFIDEFITPGRGGLAGPTGLTWGPDGSLYVPSFSGNSVLRYDGATGAFRGVFVTPGAGGLNGADNGATFGPDGNLYVPSYYGNQVLRYNGSTGAFMNAFVASIGRPRVLIFRGSDLLITSETGHSVRRYNAATGAALGTFVAARSGGLTTPVGMAFGEDGLLYVGSTGTNKILRYSGVNGAFQSEFLSAPGATIDGPAFLTFVPAPWGLGVVLAPLVLPRRRRFGVGR